MGNSTNYNLFADDDDIVVRRYEESATSNKIKYFDVDELEVIIDYYLQKGRSTDTLNAIDLGLKLHPKSTPIQMRRARLYASLGKYKEALKVIEKVNKIESADIEDMLLQGEILTKLSRLDEAEAVFDKLIEIESDIKIPGYPVPKYRKGD